MNFDRGSQESQRHHRTQISEYLFKRVHSAGGQHRKVFGGMMILMGFPEELNGVEYPVAPIVQEVPHEKDDCKLKPYRFYEVDVVEPKILMSENPEFPDNPAADDRHEDGRPANHVNDE